MHGRIRGHVTQVAVHNVHCIVLEAVARDKEHVHGEVEHVGRRVEIVTQAVHVELFELVPRLADHPHAQDDIQRLRLVHPNEEVAKVDLDGQVGAGVVDKELAVGLVLGQAHEVAGRLLAHEIRGHDHADEEDVGGCVRDEFYARLAHELADLGVREHDVEERGDREADDVQDSEQQDENGIHFGDLAHARVPDLFELLLTVRMGHKLE